MKTHVLSGSVALVFTQLFFSMLALAAPVSVSPNHFLDELATSRDYFPEVSRKYVLNELAKADLLSVGETHEQGFERKFLTAFYNDLAQTLTLAPVACLVENYESLLSESDSVRSSFAKLCPEESVYNSVSSSNYTEKLEENLSSGPILTHTGYRHMFPIALNYPHEDFATPQWVDLPEHGSIAKQIPEDFEESGKQMRGIGMRAFDELMMSTVAHDLKSVLGANLTDQDIQNEVARVKSWSASLNFKDSDQAKFFEIKRMNLSLTYAKDYLALLNRPEFKPELLVRLLTSKDFSIGCYISVSKGSFMAGNIQFPESGTIYAYGNSLLDHKIMAVSINGSHDVLTERSSF